MTENPEEIKVTSRDLFAGTALVLFSNLIYVGNSYIVTWTGLKAPEIALVRGAIQMLIFGIIVWRSSKESQQTEKSMKIGKI